MKVILVNGSPDPKGCTYTALSLVAEELENSQVETQVFHIGKKAISGCLDCGYCNENLRCVVDDKVNEFIQLAKTADGFVFGSPVHYASAGGAITAFLDRAFYSGGYALRGKVAGCVASARRAGTTAALDQLYKYPAIMEMPIVTSSYWNMVHGMSPQEVLQDLEGVQVMRTLGRNMAWMLRCIQAAQEAGIERPQKQHRIFTNFIR